MTQEGVRLRHDSEERKAAQGAYQPRKAAERPASLVDELLLIAEEERGEEARWNRPRKRRISLQVDIEVVDCFKSKGPGYQTRLNRILRRVMAEGKKPEQEK